MKRRSSVLEIKVKKMILIDWEKLEWMQGGLKDIGSTQLKKLRESLIKNGFKAPFHVWEDKNGKRWILDGHHRQRVLRELKDEGFEIPAKLPGVFIDCKNKKEAGEAVLMFASEYASITDEGLKGFMSDFSLEFLNIKDMYNFSGITDRHFINSHLRKGKGDEDNPPPPPKRAKSKPGDIYLLGGTHKLYCGDCSGKKEVDELLAGDKVKMIFTDPPYNVDYSAKNEYLNRWDKGNRNQRPIKNDNIKDFKKLALGFLGAVRHSLEEYNSVYITFGGKSLDEMIDAFKSSSYTLS